MERSKSRNGGTNESEDLRESALAAMSGAQERIRSGVEKAAEVMPDAVAGAQVAARDTQRALDEMSDQGLLAGTAFSVGLAIGLMVSGTNRLLVAIVLVPAAAMLATLMGREKEQAAATSRATRTPKA